MAVQMVYEERFISRFNVPPLAAVGWEGNQSICSTLVPSPGEERYEGHFLSS